MTATGKKRDADDPGCVARFKITAMDCPHEFALIEPELRRLDGIRQLVPNYVERTLRVEYDPARVDAARVLDTLSRIGFPARDLARPSDVGGTDPLRDRLRWTLVAVGGFLLLAAGAVHWWFPNERWHALLAVGSSLAAGWPVARAAWRAVRLRRLDMNALMTLAAVGALATAPQTGEWLEAPTALFLFGVALWLEGFSLERARRAVRTLVEFSPPSAHRLRGPAGGGTIEDVPAEAIDVGDRLLIKPGERFPVDGEVLAGQSAVNQAPITGESLPVDKVPGDAVFAGSLNGEGPLEITATRAARDSTLAHIARLVEQAQADRAPTERFIDEFARRYTPVVIVLAALIAVAPALALAAGWRPEVGVFPNLWLEWFHRGLVLLVIACPCALVISTPLTIVCGLHQATRLGALVKGGRPLEALGRVRSMAIDKTGTLTTATPRVVEVRPIATRGSDEILAVAASLEASSEHPLAVAIVESARQRGIRALPAAQIQVLRGAGIRGWLGGEEFIVGSPRLFQEQRLGGPLATPWKSEDTEAGVVVLVGTPTELLGSIHLDDQLRPEAAEAINQLREIGVHPLVLLTGDSRAAGRRIGDALGLTRVEAELLPDQKVEFVRQLTAECADLAMVGDGVNDAPAIAASAVGIAFGPQASDTALETADVVLLGHDLRRVPQLLRLGRRTRRILLQNISWAIGIKVLVFLATLFGHATLGMAVAADVGASLLVVFNGMRLLDSS